MSTWVYVSGNVILNTECVKPKLNKNGKYIYLKNNKYYQSYKTYIPYPDEQISFDYPFVSHDSTLEYHANIISYPITKRIIEKYIHKLPSGEHFTAAHWLNYDLDSANSSTSGYGYKEVEIKFKKFVLSNINWPTSWDNVMKYQPHEISYVNENNESVLTIADSIRGTTAKEMYESLIEFFSNLVKENVLFDDGIFVLDQDRKYGPTIELRFNNFGITVNIQDNITDVVKTEYWQIITTWYDDKPNTYELKKVDKIDEDNDIIDLRTRKAN